MNGRVQPCPPGTPLTETERAAVLRNRGLVYHTVFGLLRRYPHADYLKDELASEGMLGLVRAVQLYDARLAKFSTYACRAIAHRVLRVLRDNNLIHIPQYLRQDKETGVPWPAAFCLPSLAPVDCAAVAEQPEFPVDQADQMRAVYRALRELTVLQRRIIRHRFGLNRERLTLEALGQRLGYTRERVRQIEQEALTKLRRLLHADSPRA